MYWLELHDILYLVKALKFPSDNMPILRYIPSPNLISSHPVVTGSNITIVVLLCPVTFILIVLSDCGTNSLLSTYLVQFPQSNTILSLTCGNILTFILILQIHAHIITSVYAACVLCSNSFTSCITYFTFRLLYLLELVLQHSNTKICVSPTMPLSHFVCCQA